MFAGADAPGGELDGYLPASPWSAPSPIVPRVVGTDFEPKKLPTSFRIALKAEERPNARPLPMRPRLCDSFVGLACGMNRSMLTEASASRPEILSLESYRLSCSTSTFSPEEIPLAARPSTVDSMCS